LRKILVVAIATLLVAAAAWGQTDPLLGPHNVSQVGCQSCHAPHNALAGPGGYLWTRSIPTGTYTTYTTSDGEGGTLNALGTAASGTTPATNGMVGNGGTAIGSTTNPGALSTVNQLPQAHTILCLSCHDTTFSAMGCTTASGSSPCTPISTGTTGGSGGILPATDFAIGNGGNLSHDHPVDVIYPTSMVSGSGTTPTNPLYFEVTIATTADGTGMYSVTFNDATYAYGHPARLFSTDGATAYIECGSCHNPHAWLNAVVPVPGTTAGSTVNQAVPTTHFIRGQYRSTTELLSSTVTSSTYTSAQYQADNANFCMSCHMYPSASFTGLPH